MKKVLFVLMVAFAAVVTFSSCNKDDEGNVYTFVNEEDAEDILAFNVDSKTVVATYHGESESATFTVSGDKITLVEYDFYYTADVNIETEGWDKVKKISDEFDTYKKK